MTVGDLRKILENKALNEDAEIVVSVTRSYASSISESGIKSFHQKTSFSVEQHDGIETVVMKHEVILEV